MNNTNTNVPTALNADNTDNFEWESDASEVSFLVFGTEDYGNFYQVSVELEWDEDYTDEYSFGSAGRSERYHYVHHVNVNSVQAVDADGNNVETSDAETQQVTELFSLSNTRELLGDQAEDAFRD